MTVLLLLPRPEVRDTLAARLEIAQQLLGRPVSNETDLRQLETDSADWNKYNERLLERLFDGTEIAREYSHRGGRVWGGPVTLQQGIQDAQREIELYRNRLQRIFNQLELFDEPGGAEPVTAGGEESVPVLDRVVPGDSVFIVHGHQRWEHQIARFLADHSVEAVILNERVHGGTATLIEKLERESRECGFAVVLYTADDEGKAIGATGDPEPRARENVILELGYFIGKLGRDRVVLLHDGRVALPSDFQGVGWYPLTNEAEWQRRLLAELTRVGIAGE